MAETERSKEIGKLKDKAKTGPPDARIRACRRLLAMKPGRPTRDYVRNILRQLADMPDAADKANELLRQSGRAPSARKVARSAPVASGGADRVAPGEVSDETRRLPVGPRLRALYEAESKRPGFADSLRPALAAVQAARDGAFREIMAALDGKPSTLGNLEAIEGGLSDGARRLIAEFHHDVAGAEAVKEEPPECPYCHGPVTWIPENRCFECPRCPESRCHYFPREPLRPDFTDQENLHRLEG